jgi:Ice-binding-like
MSNRTRSRGARRCGVALALGLVSLAVPVAAQAAEVEPALGTAYDYSVLAGPAVTNDGISGLDAKLGVAPGNTFTDNGALTIGGGLPDLGNAAALQAQVDLTNGYNTARGEPSSSNKTGQDLVGQTLTPGTYTWSGSITHTGTVTLDALGDPAARFIFQVAADMTTQTGFQVALAPGTSACNIYWQVGNDAVIGGGNQFVGTILANNAITVGVGTTVNGRALARNAAVTLNTNQFTTPACTRGLPTTQGTPAAAPPSSTPVAAFPGAGATGNQPPAGSRATVPTRKGTSKLTLTPRARPGGTPRTGPRSNCMTGFSARVRGKLVKSVVFRLDGKRIASDRKSPFQVTVKAAAGKHKVSARVSYKDATRAKTTTVAYRGCAAVVLQPRHGPSQFTG